MSNVEVIPFGKYKGQPVEVLSQDKQYLDWLMQQDWFNTRYASIKTLIINNFREPSETPEHNKIQAMFTAGEFCKRFLDHATHITDFTPRVSRHLDFSDDEMKERLIQWEKKHGLNKSINTDGNFMKEWEYKASRRRTAELDDPLLDYKIITAGDEYPQSQKYSCLFESEGVDVVIFCQYYIGEYRTDQISFHIEIKPQLSDDYPAVLRQMMSNKSKILLTGSYTGIGATLEQVRKIFSTAGKRIILLSDFIQINQ